MHSKPLLIALALSGCATHAALIVPSASAPLEARQAALSALSPTQVDERAVTLANGARITDPRDLMPMVDSESATAKAIVRFDEGERRAEPFATAAMVTLLTGAVLELVGVQLCHASVTASPQGGTPVLNQQSESACMGLLLGGGGLDLVGLGLYLVGRLSAHPEARTEAFHSYALDLPIRLGLSPMPSAAAPGAPLPQP
jgi:hypothetical protein